MGDHYKHLQWRERTKIEDYLKAGWSPRQIADDLGRHISTVYREIKRGWGQQRTTDLVDYECYLADIAQEKYESTYSGKGPQLKIGKDHEYANYLGSVLRAGYRSPEAALGEIEVMGLEFKTKISTRTLYRYIDMGIIPGITNKDLPVKRNEKKRKLRHVRRASRSCPGLSIEQRPEEVNDRSVFGHWEADSVESGKNGKGRIFKLTERLSRNEIIFKVKSGEARHVVAALDRLERKLGDMFYIMFRSITVDNGSEFSDLEGMERSCRGKGRRTTIYYCHPYSSWEKGTAERQNGMIRRRYPKGTNFSKVPARELQDLADWLNHYPRKIFGFHCAATITEASLASL